ncbi:MAG: secretin N-terminal domain-containing protein [Candidatus Omnitrophota bacterium]
MIKQKHCLAVVSFIFLLSLTSIVAAEVRSEGAQVAGDEAAKEQGTKEEDKIPGGMQGFVSLDLRSIDVIDALKFLSKRANLNIVTTKNVAGRVTLMVENVLVKDVFDIMLRANKLAYDQRGQIYNVMTEEEYRALYGRPFSDTREVVTFRLKYAIPDQAFSLFDTLKSEIGRVLVDPESGHALIIDIPERVREMSKALEAFEQKNEVRIFQLQYAKAKDVEEQLKGQLEAKKLGSIKADERANQVIVQTLSERMKEIERLIRQLDTKTKEVVIDVIIIKLKLSDENTKGTEWEGLFNTLKLKNALFYMGSTPFATINPVTTAGTFTSRGETLKNLTSDGLSGTGSYPFSGTTSSLASSTPAVGTEKLNIGLVGKQDFNTVLKYLQTLGSSKILANPKLVVTNNQESRIHVGEKQAYVTTTTTTGQVTSTVAEQVTFVDIGTQLSITPAINEDGYVTMKVKAEISSVSSILITPTQNKIPIIDTSLAETTVMVKEGTTIIIGGLRKDERTESAKKTPFLSKIPLIGELFKSGTNTIAKTELIIMLTPKIITGDVLVTEAGQKVEESGVKGRQEYNAVKPAVPDAGFSGIVPSLEGGKKIIFKGLRIVE